MRKYPHSTRSKVAGVINQEFEWLRGASDLSRSAWRARLGRPNWYVILLTARTYQLHLAVIINRNYAFVVETWDHTNIHQTRDLNVWVLHASDWTSRVLNTSDAIDATTRSTTILVVLHDTTCGAVTCMSLGGSFLILPLMVRPPLPLNNNKTTPPSAIKLQLQISCLIISTCTYMYMFVGSQNSYNTWYKANFQVKFRKDNIHHCAVSARSTDLHANLSLPLPRQISRIFLLALC